MSSTTSSLSWCSSDPSAIQSLRHSSNGSRIRKNLLFKLGVKSNNTSASLSHSTSTCPSKSILGKFQTCVVPLKSCEEEDISEELVSQQRNTRSMCTTMKDPWGGTSFPKELDVSHDTERTLSCSFSSHSELSTQASSPPRSNIRQDQLLQLKPRKKLTFHNQVLVCHIPKHTEYSQRIKSCLWTPAEEAACNFARNSIEFAAEGNDWRYALEDCDMYRDPTTQELIHPIHVELWREQSGMGSDEFFYTQKTQEFYEMR